VGVVADAKYGNLRERATPMLYVPFTQYPAKLNELQVRTATDPSAVAAQLRRELAAVDRRIAVVRVSRMQDQVDASIAGERLIARLASVFGLLALLLSAVGVYGVVAYLSAQRSVEIGIRMALGARRPQVLWLVLRQVLVLVVAGGLAGTVVAILASRLVVSQLHGLTAQDPFTIVVALVALSGAALAAGCIPASRATRIDPVIALRAE
jgi:predicted lysophospholipase L1 biosynthesis ABC-type transport system permease subunit